MTNCPSCDQAITATDHTCATCGFALVRPGRSAQTVIRPVARPKIPVEVTVGIAIDTTGSSAQFADGIRNSTEAMLRPVEAKAASVRCVVQTHGDEDEGQMPTVVADGVTCADAVTTVQALVFDGGGDPAEHHLDAVEHLMNVLPSSQGRRRVAMIVFTTDDTKAAKSGRSAANIGADLQHRGIIVCFVGTPGTGLEALTAAAGGFFFEIDRTPSSDEMQTVVARISASIIASVTQAPTTPMPGTIPAAH